MVAERRDAKAILESLKAVINEKTGGNK